ncbi:MAG: hypothetical protein EKK65_11130 [Lysobacterales bacterium]|nr:MAG: hypothetical protein EKK65_11130 [Xanthomonadales bacterium]
MNLELMKAGAVMPFVARGKVTGIFGVPGDEAVTFDLHGIGKIEVEVADGSTWALGEDVVLTIKPTRVVSKVRVV